MSNPKHNRTRSARSRRPAAKQEPAIIDMFLGEEHWCAAMVPSADQIIVMANRDRAELGRMLACWQAR